MNGEEKKIEPAYENVISQLWFKFFPYWPVFILLIVLATAAAWFYLNTKPQMYLSSATLLIKDEKKGIEDSKMIASLNTLSGKKIIENEIEVIRSRALMNEVVNSLKLYAPVYEQGKWADRSAYETSPVVIEVKSPDSLVEVSKIYFGYNPVKAKIELKGQLYSLNQWINTPWGVLRFTQNNKNYKYTQPLYFTLVNPKRVVQNLLSGLDVFSAGKLSSVVKLTLKSETPKCAEEILNTLIAAYQVAAEDDKNTLAKNALHFLDERLKYVSNDLSSIEQQLQQYRKQNGAIDISAQGKLFLQNVSANDQKLSEVNMKLGVLGQVEESLSQKDGNSSMVPSTLGIDDPSLTNLLTKLYSTQLEYQRLKGTTGENNPELLSLKDQIGKIRPAVLENMRSQRLSLQESKRNLLYTNNSYNTVLQDLPEQEKDLVQISREQTIKNSIYSFLLQKREETALSLSSMVNDTRVVDKAASSLNPVGLGKGLAYAIASALAMICGIVLISIRELFNRKILFRHELETLTSFPVVGEIAQEKSKHALVIADGTKSWIAEEFRLLRTSLHYLGIKGNGKNILVTSTLPGEGKSFVSVNLAMTLAISGKKVIVVDFDLMNPTLGTKLGENGENGVSDYLLGNVQLKDVIRKSPKNEFLYIITAGSPVMNPSELILSARTAALMDELKNEFDYIIIDSAPVGVLSDGYVLSKYCDATLYVVRHNYTPKKVLERLQSNNRINTLNNIALVFNGVRSRGFTNDRYGYGFEYGYEYYLKQRKNKNLLTI